MASNHHGRLLKILMIPAQRRRNHRYLIMHILSRLQRLSSRMNILTQWLRLFHFALGSMADEMPAAWPISPRRFQFRLIRLAYYVYSLRNSREWYRLKRIRQPPHHSADDVPQCERLPHVYVSDTDDFQSQILFRAGDILQKYYRPSMSIWQSLMKSMIHHYTENVNETTGSSRFIISDGMLIGKWRAPLPMSVSSMFSARSVMVRFASYSRRRASKQSILRYGRRLERFFIGRRWHRGNINHRRERHQHYEKRISQHAHFSKHWTMPS